MANSFLFFFRNTKASKLLGLSELRSLLAVIPAVEKVRSDVAEVAGIPTNCGAIKARRGYLLELSFHQVRRDVFFDTGFSAKNMVTSSKGFNGPVVGSSPKRMSMAVLAVHTLHLE